MSGAAFARGQSKQDYQTPEDFMLAVKRRFGKISYDLAAHAQNTQCTLFFTEADNSLVQCWADIETASNGWLWLNPQFDNIAPWAEKCAKESADGARILFLVPASIGANWFRDHVHGKAMVFALNGRMSFDGKNPYPKDCILCAYSHGSCGFDVWNWKGVKP